MTKGSLIRECLRKSDTVSLTNTGALCTYSGEHTGRSPGGKFIVEDNFTKDTVDWTNNNPMSQGEWDVHSRNVESYIYVHTEHGKDFYSVNASAGRRSEKKGTKKSFKFICESPVQKLFIENMFSAESEHEDIETEGSVFVVPSYGKEPKVVINFSEKKIYITGTWYLGEIKKSIFTYMNYALTDSGVLPMHCSVNTDLDGKNPAIFFGLSGTGKTTLSSSNDRLLIGDDEHGWSNGFIFNIESGCYAKTAGLSEEAEPEIFKACQKFGSILENVKLRSDGLPKFDDHSLTKNGRASYPIEYLDKIVTGGQVCENAKNVIMLTCDATGVLPAVSKLTCEKAKEMFLAGYTSKVAGTEVGVNEPEVVFSACFGAPFLPRDPNVYADMLGSLLEETGANCWLVNTGWVGGPPGLGNRMDLKTTRMIIRKILSGELSESVFEVHSHTNLSIPASIPGSSFATAPEDSWKNLKEYEKSARSLMKKIEERISFLSG